MGAEKAIMTGAYEFISLVIPFYDTGKVSTDSGVGA
jgi:hypothetical protein